MFDRHYYKSESKVVAVTKEIEKTISPDKVTEMYDKVRAQAEHDVVASLRVDSNLLNGVVVQVADEYSTATSRVYTRFTLNGKEHEDMNVLAKWEVLSNNRMYEILSEHYARVVKNVLLKNFVEVFSPAFIQK
jgi:hypothetical protein